MISAINEVNIQNVMSLVHVFLCNMSKIMNKNER